MFDKLKQLAQLKNLQNEIAKEKFIAEESGIKVVVNGAMSIEEISFANSSIQGEVVKNCVNSALKKAQLGAAKKMASMNLF